jgi:hypothetical protein
MLLVGIQLVSPHAALRHRSKLKSKTSTATAYCLCKRTATGLRVRPPYVRDGTAFAASPAYPYAHWWMQRRGARVCAVKLWWL